MAHAVRGDVSLTELARLDQPDFYEAELDHIHAVFARMRHEEPVFWYEPGRFWVLAKHEDQRYVGSQPELFCSRYGFSIGDNFDPAVVAEQLPGWAQRQLAQESLTRAQVRGLISRATLSMGDPELVNLGTLDPPQHGQVRKVFTHAFSPTLIRGLRPVIERVTDDVLGALDTGATHEVVETVAARIPSALVIELADIPIADRAEFVPWSTAFLDAASLTTETDPERVARIRRWADEFIAYLARLIETRREQPGEDVVSRIAAASIDGEPLSRSTALMLAVLFIAGGSDTSRRLLAQIVQALADHPDQRALLRRHPELIPNAVDEVLRFYPIVWTQCRTAVEDTQIRGRTIHKDDFIVLPYASANRDEEVWERSDEFDVARAFDAAHRHQGFGWGAHGCPGAAMARLVATVFIERLLHRFVDWEIVGTPERCHRSIFMNGIESMQVRFVAEGAA